MITLKSQAGTARIAAANAIMLAQDTGQPVLLQWREYEISVFPDDTTEDVVRIMAQPGCEVW